MNACLRAVAASTSLALLAAGESAPGQQLPPSGCNACAGASHGFANPSIPTFRILGPGRPDPVSAPSFRLHLPPRPDRHDVGAIDASTQIVLGRNRRLRESLAVAAAAARPPAPEVTPRPGEVLIRIASINLPPPLHRQDVPANKFEAIPLRGVSFPQWSPRPR